jgi:thioredoxin-related protein
MSVMKKILFALLLATLSYANHIHWLGDYDKALEIAHKQNKPLMVLLVKNPCQSCSLIIKNHLTNKRYLDHINENFICVIVTYEGRLSYPVEMYYSTTFPTLFFVDSSTEHFLKPPLYGQNITKMSIKKAIGE